MQSQDQEKSMLGRFECTEAAFPFLFPGSRKPPLFCLWYLGWLQACRTKSQPLYLWGAGWHSFCSRGPIMGEWPCWLMPFLLFSFFSLLYLSPALCVQGSPPPHASMGLPLVCQTTQADSLPLRSPRSNWASSLCDPHSNSASILHGPHSNHVLLLQGPSLLTQPYFPMASV